MRPPDLPGGNPLRAGSRRNRAEPSFNEAAGFTRRKLSDAEREYFSRVASMRPPDLPGGNSDPARHGPRLTGASMRPPDLPGGNRRGRRDGIETRAHASMRPPDLPGGNDGSQIVKGTSVVPLQ